MDHRHAVTAAALAALLTLAPAAHAQQGMLTCKDFVAMPESQQLLFIHGMEEGIGAALGIGSVFARELDALAATQEEKLAIQRMATMPRGYLSQAQLPRGPDTLKAVVAKCSSQQFVGLAYVEAVSAR